MPEPAAIGIDIGGTKIAVGAVFGDGRLEHVVQLPTGSAMLEGIAAAAASVAEELEPSVEIAVGAYGAYRHFRAADVDADRDRLSHC